MNPVFNNTVPCLICKKDQWEFLANVKRSKVVFDLKICSNCGFVAQNPPFSEEYLQNYYENNYVINNYSNTMTKIHQMFGPANARIKYLRENNYLSKLHRVLEIGPGAGTMMKLLSDHGIEIAGIEPDREAASWIEKNLKIPTFQGFFDTVYDHEKENWYKNLYDGIIIIHVLEHISDPFNFLSKLKKIMTREGLLIIEIPNIRRPFSDENKWETYCDLGHLHYFSKNTLKILLNRSGFTPISITDKIFEPYGNIFCVANKINIASNLDYTNEYLDNPIDVKNVWSNFMKYHKWRWFKHKISSILKRIKFY